MKKICLSACGASSLLNPAQTLKKLSKYSQNAQKTKKMLKISQNEQKQVKIDT